MSLETQIEKLNANLEALLALAKAGASAQTVVSGEPKTAQQAADALFGQFAGGEPSPAGLVTETAPEKAKAEKAKAEKAKPAPAEAKTPTKDEAQKAVLALVKAKGRDAAVKVLGEFGAENLSAVPAEQYAAVIEACGKAAA